MPTSPAATSLVQHAAPAATHHFTLDNDFQVVLLEDHRAPLVTAQLWYHVGASDEPAGQSGLSHTLEHLVFTGSRKLPRGQYSNVLARLGAHPRAFTLDDATLYVTTLPVNRLEIVLEAQADIMAHALLDPQAFSTVRDTLINEYRLRVDTSPDEQANLQHLRLAHGPSPYARSRYEALDELQAMTLAQVRDWYARHYHPNNATLVVAGDLTLPELRTRVERHFADLPAIATQRAVAFSHSTALGERRQTVQIKGLRPGVALSFNTPSLSTAPAPQAVYALHVALTLLSTGASSRLHSALVRDEPILRGVLSEFDWLARGDTLLTLRALISPGQITPQQAGERILNIVDSLIHHSVTAAELQRAKTQLLAHQVFRRDALQDHAYDVGRYQVSGAGPQAFAQARAWIEAVSTEDIQDAARQYLTRERLTVTYTQPEENAQ